MHDLIAAELLRIEREQLELLHEILLVIRRNVTGGRIRQTGAGIMVPFAPGQAPQFQVTVTPTGVAVNPASSVWTVSGAITTVASVDPTGTIATVDIPSTASVGTEFTLVWTYTNADATTATAEYVATIVAAVLPTPDITGGVIAQIA
jgi:hypothetical protein